ncbi:unnamed protein product [Phytomonas sp. EM1]|nr:unnamed protein product [Phytomonas sp. EM1]|eukprot:CCW64309.1 unnamed protein product [Phytomonas sp. isolate EM1]
MRQRDSLHWNLVTPPEDSNRMQVAEWYTPRGGSQPFHIALRLKPHKGLHHHHYVALSIQRPLFALCYLPIECLLNTDKNKISLLNEAKVVRVFQAATDKVQILYGCYLQSYYKLYYRVYKFTGQALLPVSQNPAMVLLQAHATRTNCVAIASNDDPKLALMLIQTPRNSKMVRVSDNGIMTEVDVTSWVPLVNRGKRFGAKYLCYNSHNSLAVGGLIWQDTFKGKTIFQLFKLNDGAFPTTSLFYEIDVASFADSDVSLVSSCGLVHRLRFEGCRLVPEFEDGNCVLAIEIDISVRTPVVDQAPLRRSTWHHCGGGSYRAIISWRKYAGFDSKGGGDAVRVSSFDKIEITRAEMHSLSVRIGETDWIRAHQPFVTAAAPCFSAQTGLLKLSKNCRDQMTRWWELPNSFTTWCCVHLHLTYLDACWLYAGILFFILVYKALNLFFFLL